LPYASLTQQDKDQLQARLATLAESLSQVPAALGLA
jgi:iron uptake system EfeUOB component EfeO/EfeM